MHLHVIRVRQGWCVNVPFLRVIVHEASQHGHQRPVIPLSLPVGLRMLRAGERIRYSEDLACFLEELGRELRAIIRQGLLVIVRTCTPNGGRTLPLPWRP